MGKASRVTVEPVALTGGNLRAYSEAFPDSQLPEVLAYRAERVTLDNGEAVQALVPGVDPITPSARALAVLAKRRATVTHTSDFGPLFDEVAKAQPDLFG